ncbi:hypothetical protein RB195_010371 [Necator americanus]|uniref:Uncharacterized protein n=1 Tax=Necator americanus TaxID=51031 RepID=A0ABR1CZG3_NECAM
MKFAESVRSSRSGSVEPTRSACGIQWCQSWHSRNGALLLNPHTSQGRHKLTSVSRNSDVSSSITDTLCSNSTTTNVPLPTCQMAQPIMSFRNHIR